MPTNTLISNTTDLTLDLSIKSLSKRSMSTIKVTTTDMSDSSNENIITDNDEIKIFECEKHDEDNNDRLSPVIKEESSLQIPTDHSNSEQQQFQNFFPYFISPYYQTNNNIQTFEKIPSLESLSKFISPPPPPPPAHISNSNINIDQNPGIYPLPSSQSFQSSYSPHWRSSMFPFVFPSSYSFSSNSSSHINSKDFINDNNFSRKYKQHISYDEHKQKKSHIKKPLNAFMLFMKEQRSQVVQECTLRESAAINQILGRKWHELDRNVQQKYYDMARDERMKHMQLYPGWSARDNYGARKKRTNKGKKRDKNQECLNQKKCRARFGLEQQANWCKHCKRKKKCLRYTENETTSISVTSWSDEDDTDNIDDSDDGDIIPMIEPIHNGIAMDSDEENKLRLLKYQQNQSFHTYSFLPKTTMPILNEFKREI